MSFCDGVCTDTGTYGTKPYLQFKGVGSLAFWGSLGIKHLSSFNFRFALFRNTAVSREDHLAGTPQVLIMVKLSNDAGICQIRDFGVSDQGYFIAMKLYSSSLRQWRLQESRPLHEMVCLRARGRDLLKSPIF